MSGVQIPHHPPFPLNALPELWVVRHGETEWNRLGRWQGALDSPLTLLGETQARALGAMLRRLGIGPATHDVLCSPQGRAVRTVELMFGSGIARRDARLREIEVGEWTGRLLEEILREPGLPPEPDLWTLYSAPPKGEGFVALEARCSALLAGIDGPTVLVTHGMTGRILRALALGRSAREAMALPSGQGAAFRLAGGQEIRHDPGAADRAAASARP